MFSTLRAWKTAVKTKHEPYILYFHLFPWETEWERWISCWMWSIGWMKVFQLNVFNEINFKRAIYIHTHITFVSFMVMRRNVILPPIKWRKYITHLIYVLFVFLLLSLFFLWPCNTIGLYTLFQIYALGLLLSLVNVYCICVLYCSRICLLKAMPNNKNKIKVCSSKMLLR